MPVLSLQFRQLIGKSRRFAMQLDKAIAHKIVLLFVRFQLRLICFQNFFTGSVCRNGMDARPALIFHANARKKRLYFGGHDECPPAMRSLHNCHVFPSPTCKTANSCGRSGERFLSLAGSLCTQVETLLRERYFVCCGAPTL